MLIQNAIVSSVTKNKEGIGYFGYNFYVQNKDKLKEVKIKDENGKQQSLRKNNSR